MISLGVMQMTQNMQKNQKKFQYDSEINEMLTRVQMGLRDKAACERTFVGASDTANAPTPLAPVTTYADATADYTNSTALVNTLYSGNEDGAGNSMVMLQVGQTYGAVGGRFSILEIKLHSADPVGAMNQLTRARVGIKIRKQGPVDDRGDADPSNDVLKASWGPAEVVKNFDIMITVWDAADPARAGAGGTTGELRSCFVSEDYYVNAACKALGGTVDTDGACKNLAVGKLTEAYPADTLNNESVSWEFLVEGNSRLKNNLEVGYDNGAETDPAALTYFSPIEADPLYGTQGLAHIQNYLFVGFEADVATGTNDVPSAVAGDFAQGGIVAKGNLFVGSDNSAALNNIRNGSVGNGVFTNGSLYSGFNQATDLNTVSVAAGQSGDVVAAQGMTVRNIGNTGYGLDIRDEGAPIARQLLKVGDDTAFHDVDVANTLALRGDANSDRATLQLGTGAASKITGRSNRIGINEPNPLVQLDVNGNTRIDGNIDVNGNGDISGYLTLGQPTINQVPPDNYAATTGWVRQRIANTLAPDSTTRGQIASDILNTTFNEAGSALRVIQQNYCTRLQIRTGYTGTSYAAAVYGTWSGGRCVYYVKNCGYNNHCNNVYANNGVIADAYVYSLGFIRANSYIRAYGTSSYIRTDSYMYASSYIRTQSRFCIGGTDPRANCITRIPNVDCGYLNKVRGIHNGYVQCATDIKP